MNIKPMLARLQNAIGQDNLIEQIVLLSEPKTPFTERVESAKSINLIVGYDSSPNSHTALDITLWIAHQTRLATKVQVTVQVVYVLEDNQTSYSIDALTSEEVADFPSIPQVLFKFPSCSLSRVSTPVLTETKLQVNRACLEKMLLDPFEEADRILWQARCLAEEWKGSFKAHLRFGCVAEELQKVVESEAAALLFLGCNSINHPIVQKLGSNFPCTVLGIPNCIDDTVNKSDAWVNWADTV